MTLDPVLIIHCFLQFEFDVNMEAFVTAILAHPFHGVRDAGEAHG